jgi:phosphate transport system permease protein
VPLSLGTAVFLVRIAAGWLVAPVSFLVEFLAAVPSIAYGIWGLFVMGPFLRQHVEPSLNQAFLHTPGLRALGVPAGAVAGRDMLAGGLILGVMVVPIITAIARDVLRNVPRAQVEGTVALGATWWESSKEMLKFSRSGLFGAVMLGLARAAGETMAITMVIGNNNQIRASLFAPAQTMSSLLANEFGDTGGAHRGRAHPAGDVAGVQRRRPVPGRRPRRANSQCPLTSDSQLPTPNSQLPTPNSQLPTPNSQLSTQNG